MLDKTLYVSVLDVIRSIGHVNPSQSLNILKKKWEIEKPLVIIRKVKFPPNGRSNNTTSDAATISDANLIVAALESREALGLTKSVVGILSSVLPHHIVNRVLGHLSTLSCANGTFAYRLLSSLRECDATYVYVRIRLPDHLLVDNPESSKALTLSILKYGITACLGARNDQYGDDNGFFAYTFKCISRYHAEAAERALRFELQSATVYSSFEYVNAHRVASLANTRYQESYQMYHEVARRVFFSLVNRVKLMWPQHYTGYGTMHKAEKGHVSKGTAMSPTDMQEHTQLGFLNSLSHTDTTNDDIVNRSAVF